MLGPDEALTLLIETPLTHPTFTQKEPNVIRPVLVSDPLTVLRIRLNVPCVTPLLHPLNFFHLGRSLPGKIPLDKLFNRVARGNTLLLLIHLLFIRRTPNRKQRKGLKIRIF